MLVGVNYVFMKSAVKLPSFYFYASATQEQLNHYRELLEAYIKSIIIPYHLVVCTDVHCTRHMIDIEHPYCSIVNVMLIAGRNAIPYSKPPRSNPIPNWRTKIEPSKEMALFWHSEYCERGRPDSGFYFEMRKYSRKVYHAKRRGHYKTTYVQKMANIASFFTERK